MARAKFTSLETAITGKQGGQSIAYGRNGFTLRNTTQPPITASTKQSYQRLITGSLWQLYSTLSPAQKTAWSTESINYPWVDSLGNARNRSGFETFSFCNQNLLILGLPFLTDPATFAGIVKPVVNVVSTSETTFVIQSDNTNVNQEYAVFVQLFQSVGRSSIQPNKILIVNLTAAQLSAGYNLVPDYSAIIPTPQSIYSAIIKVVAINVNNGNRDLDGVIVRQLVDPTGLGLDILSYYPFNGNANDYFGVNNGTAFNVAFPSNGLVSNSAYFLGNLSSYINLGRDSSFNFGGVSLMGSFSVLFWVKFETNSVARFVSKVGVGSFGTGFTLELVASLTNQTFVIYNGSIPNRRAIRFTETLSLDTWYFVALSYTNGSVQIARFNNANPVLVEDFGSYVGSSISDADVILGRHVSLANLCFNGWLCELTFLNGAISQSNIDAIYAANLAGQTIIDIN